MRISRAPQSGEELPENLTTGALLVKATKVTEDFVNMMFACATDGKAHTNRILASDVRTAGRQEEGRWESDLGHHIYLSTKRKKRKRQASTDMKVRVVPSEDTNINLLKDLEGELVRVWRKKNRGKGDISTNGLLEYLEGLDEAGHKEFMLDMAYTSDDELEDVTVLHQLKLTIRMRDPMQRGRIAIAFDPIVSRESEEKKSVDLVTREVYRRAIEELETIVSIERRFAMNRLLEIACRTGNRVQSVTEGLQN